MPLLPPHYVTEPPRGFWLIAAYSAERRIRYAIHCYQPLRRHRQAEGSRYAMLLPRLLRQYYT